MHDAIRTPRGRKPRAQTVAWHKERLGRFYDFLRARGYPTTLPPFVRHTVGLLLHSAGLHAEDLIALRESGINRPHGLLLVRRGKGGKR